MKRFTVEAGHGGQRLHVVAKDDTHARNKARRQFRKLGKLVDVNSMVVLFGWCGS